MKRNWRNKNDESTDEVTKWGTMKGMQTVWLKYKKEVVNRVEIICTENRKFISSFIDLFNIHIMYI